MMEKEETLFLLKDLQLIVWKLISLLISRLLKELSIDFDIERKTSMDGLSFLQSNTFKLLQSQ